MAFYVHGRHVPAAVMRIFLSREELHLCSRRAIRLISGLLLSDRDVDNYCAENSSIQADLL